MKEGWIEIKQKYLACRFALNKMYIFLRKKNPCIEIHSVQTMFVLLLGMA